MKEETKIFKNNIVAITVLVIVLILGIVGVTLAVSYNMSSNVNISTATLAVDYTGSTILASNGLVPIEDSTIDSTNAANVMKTNFTIKGAASNPANTKIIYDVVLTNVNIDSTLDKAYHKYFKWRLKKNGALIDTGTFADFDLSQNRHVLTPTQQALPANNATADRYELAIWITESCPGSTVCGANKDQTPMLGKKISGKIDVNLYTTK